MLHQGTAFSAHYIDSVPSGVKFENVHFQLLHLAPGTLDAAFSTIEHNRLCSIAVGRLDIKVGNKEFSLGEHGIWRLRPGEKCSISNPYGIEVVAHVSTFRAE
jgi:hypothetical protein